MVKRCLWLCFLFVFLSAFLGCDSDPDPSSDADVTGDTDTNGDSNLDGDQDSLPDSDQRDADNPGCTHLIIDEQGIPFPWNRWTEADTNTATGLRIHLDPSPVGLPTGLIEQFDGFSPFGRAVLAFSRDLPESVLTSIDGQENSPVQFIGLSDSVQGQRVGLLASLDEDDESILVLKPIRPLAYGQTYAFVVTDDLILDSEGCFVENPNENMIDEETLTALTNAGEDLGHAVAVLPFTVGSREHVTADLTTISAGAQSTPASAPVFTHVSDCEEDPSARRCSTGVALFAEGTATSTQWTDEKEYNLCRDDNGLPNPCGTFDIPLYLLVPEGYESGDVPVIIFLHGIESTKNAVFSLGSTLLEAGFALLAFDLPCHGGRARSELSTIDLFGLQTSMFRVDIFKANLAQATGDAVALARLISNEGQIAVGSHTVNFDTTAIHVSGHSLGGIIGSLVCAASPDLDSCALNVPGGRLTDVIDLNDVYRMLIDIYIPPNEDLTTQVFLGFGQLLLDTTDSGLFAHHHITDPLTEIGVSPHNVLIQVATEDEVIVSMATYSLAHAGNLPLLQPNILSVPGLQTEAAPVTGNVSGSQGNATGGVFQFQGIHTAMYETDSSEEVGVIMQNQIVHMLQTGEIAEP